MWPEETPATVAAQRLAIQSFSTSLQIAASGFNTKTISHGLGLTGIVFQAAHLVRVGFTPGFHSFWDFKCDQGVVLIQQWFHYIYNDDFPPQTLMGAVKLQSTNGALFVGVDNANVGLQANDVTFASYRDVPAEGAHGWFARMIFLKGSDHVLGGNP